MAKPGELTDKQALFVMEYLIDLNATQAAIRAGYSKKTARQQGTENLAKPVVAQEIAVKLKEREERLRVDADWVLRKLVDEASADVSDLYNKDGGLKSVHDWPKVWRTGLVSGIDVEEVRSGKNKEGIISKIKLSDRVKRIELIGRHTNIQAWNDKKTVDIGKDTLAALMSEVSNTSKGPPAERGKR